MSLGRRSLTAVGWNMGANVINVAVLLVRTVLLARLLPVEIFGIYAVANAIVRISIVLPEFGLRDAFLHRAPESEDEGEAAATHLSLRLLLTTLWVAGMIAAALWLTEGTLQLALVMVTVALGGSQLMQTPRVILQRRVVHRRLALIQTLNAPLTTIVAVGLAWRGAGIWALLATDIVSLVLDVIMLYLWRPVWRPRLGWSWARVRYFLDFGRRSLVADGLARALDRVDDLWAGIFLGDAALGFYSRAYKFATYPRQLLAMPINSVSSGTYAELKGERLALSQAFFRTNAFLVRSGFLLAGLLALVAPEFIRILLGTKWLPMLDAFRLMLVFTLFDPIKTTVANLFVAVGKPELIVRARGVQMAVLGVALFLLGPALGIVGVALAVDLMLVVGIGLLLWQARPYVDFSARKLFLGPLIALGIAMLVARGSLLIPGVLGDPWRTGLVKTVLFLPLYGGLLLLLERRETMRMIGLVRGLAQEGV